LEERPSFDVMGSQTVEIGREVVILILATLGDLVGGGSAGETGSESKAVAEIPSWLAENNLRHVRHGRTAQGELLLNEDR
jgi:hypothetical protein